MSMAQKLLALLIGGAAAAYALDASGQPCLDPYEIKRTLASEHGESVAASGLTRGGYIFNLYVNHATGTWTVVVILPSGCAVVPETGQSMHVNAPGVDG